MGITGELVRSVFSRNRSLGSQDTNTARNKVIDKKRWRSSVRSYLCGDEFNSVLAEEDSASVKSSEATVTQPISEGLGDHGENQIEETKPNTPEATHNSISKLFHEEDAAMVIQSAFRHFLARRRNTEIKTKDDDKQEPLTQSPSRESIGTSIEVQTGNSVEVFSVQVQEESKAVHYRLQQKPKAQVLRIKEDWDDSTVSSNISKMRIQNKLEAMTRRERALAYAFSQQLRICSKRKQAKPDGTEQDMSWSWLERWMATRVPESSIGENSTNKQFEPVDNNHRFVVKKGTIDIAGEEKESCGSNEVSVQLESLSVTTPKGKDGYRPSKNRLKTTRGLSRRRTAPRYQLSKESGKVCKIDGSVESVKYKRHKSKRVGGQKEMKCNNANDQISLDALTS